MQITFSIDSNSAKDIVALKAITSALANLPPDGFVSVPAKAELPKAEAPPEINIHAPASQLKEAKEALNAVPEATTVDVPDVPVDPEPTPAPPAGDEATKQRLRALLIEASKLEGVTVAAAKEVALKAAGVKDARDLPTCPNVDKAISALEALIGGKA